MAEEAHPLIGQVRREMGDTWRCDDQLLDKLFPIEPTSNSKYKKARQKLYNEDKRYKRWKGIYRKPRSLGSLYTPLTNLMNDILLHYEISPDHRLFFSTRERSRPRAASPPKDFLPSIFLAGIGSEFANTSVTLPRARYSSAISAIEVSLDSDDLVEARDRLAVGIHQIFQNQDNRRFAYGVIITQSIFTVYMFDHSGAVASEPCDYHAHPDVFCAVISGLASDGQRIGFDLSIFSDPPHTRIRALEPGDGGTVVEARYTITESLFRFRFLVGRGTICWRTSGPAGMTYVVKDAWIAPCELPGRESEGSLLRHAQSHGIASGVVQIRQFEEIRRSADPTDLDTILRNRRFEDGSPQEGKLERVHTRIVMKTYGKTLDGFATRRELLLAFHDAVLAHRKLHDVAGILHRDISVRNILINPEGDEGDRGILIDFDHAIRVGDTSPYSTKRKIGTWRYMSRNVLEERGPHTYFDDLESFFYVFWWILVAFEGPGKGRAQLPPVFSEWDGITSSMTKHGLLASPFVLPVSPWFGKSLTDLAIRLHRFFKLRRTHIGRPLSSLDAAKDYDEFLGHIHRGIVDLEQEPEPNEEVALPISNKSATQLSRKRDRGTDSDAWSMSPPPLPRRARRKTIDMLTEKRPRRAVGKYRRCIDG